LTVAVAVTELEDTKLREGYADIEGYAEGEVEGFTDLAGYAEGEVEGATDLAGYADIVEAIDLEG